LSALRTERLYPPGEFPDTHFWYGFLTMSIQFLLVLRFTMNFPFGWVQCVLHTIHSCTWSWGPFLSSKRKVMMIILNMGRWPKCKFRFDVWYSSLSIP